MIIWVGSFADCQGYSFCLSCYDEMSSVEFYALIYTDSIIITGVAAFGRYCYGYVV